MNPVSCTLLLQTFIDRVADTSGEFLKIYKDRDGWNVETDNALSVRTSLNDAVEVAIEKLNAEYPDPEAAERAEYERLRLKYGGAPLPEPEPPGVWVGLVWDGDSWLAESAFTKEADADLWLADYPQHRSVSRVPYHESWTSPPA